MLLNSNPLLATPFVSTLCTWQTDYGRHHLPWQQQPTAYHVFISEMMLQQTQVKTVIQYYQRWITQLPRSKP